MEQAKGHSEVIDREVVYDSNAGPRPDATRSFLVSDDDILRAQGHKAVFKRSFSIISSLGFAFKYVYPKLYFALIMLNYTVSRMLGLALSATSDRILDTGDPQWLYSLLSLLALCSGILPWDCQNWPPRFLHLE